MNVRMTRLAALLAALVTGSPAAATGPQIASLDGGQWDALFRDAEAAAAAGDFGRAVERLQRAVEFGGDRLVPAAGPGDDAADGDDEAAPGRTFAPRGLVARRRPAPVRTRWRNSIYITAAERARRLLAELPAAGREAYRAAFEPRARELLDQAVAEGDGRLLETVARDFAPTRSGLRARSILAERLLERGYLRRAVALLGEVLSDLGLEEEPNERPRLRLRFLAALRILGEDELYAAERERFVASRSDEIGSREAASEIAGLERRVPPGARSRVIVAPVSGAASGKSFTDRLPALAATPGEYVLEWKNWFWAQPENGVAPAHDLFSPNRVIDFSRHLLFVPEIAGDEIYLSGVFHLWKIELDGGRVLAASPKPAVPVTAYGYQESSESPLYTATFHDGLVLATTISRLVPGQQYMRYVITVPLPTRSLTAFDAATGKALWDTRRFAVGPPEDPKFVSVVTPPLVRDGKVVVGCVYLAGLFTSMVAAFDLGSGEPLWQTRLVSSQMELTMFGEPAREPFASVLVEDEGIVYCITQLGAVAALDIDDGGLLWLATYDTIQTTPTIGPYPELRDIVWGTNPPLLVDGVLYAAPRDSHSFYALDTGLRCVAAGTGTPAAAGGSILHRYLNVSGKLRDVLGYREGKIWFGGPGGIQAVEVADVAAGSGGVIPRVVAGPGSTRVYGKAAMTDRGIVFTTPAGIHLLDYELTEVVDLTSGPLGHAAGNVTVEGSRVILTSRDLLSSFVRRAELPPREEF